MSDFTLYRMDVDDWTGFNAGNGKNIRNIKAY